MAEMLELELELDAAASSTRTIQTFADELEEQRRQLLAVIGGPPPEGATDPLGTLIRRVKRRVRFFVQEVCEIAADATAVWERASAVLPRACVAHRLAFAREAFALIDHAELLAASAVQIVTDRAAHSEMDTPDLLPRLAEQQATLASARRQVVALIQSHTEPFVPRDPERYAEAMRPDREVTWVSADDAIARFRRGQK